MPIPEHLTLPLTPCLITARTTWPGLFATCRCEWAKACCLVSGARRATACLQLLHEQPGPVPTRTCPTLPGPCADHVQA